MTLRSPSSNSLAQHWTTPPGPSADASASSRRRPADIVRPSPGLGGEGDVPSFTESLVAVAEEVPIALTYDHAAHAVMMATPQDLEDFGRGFSFTEGIITGLGELTEIAVVPRPNGVELRMALAEGRQEAMQRRRRHMAGPVGCGLCGLESLEAAIRPLRPLVSAFRLPAEQIPQAVAALADAQYLHHQTHAAHAAGFWQPGAPGEGLEGGVGRHADGRLLCAREDVGRHNALDKLIGALLAQGIGPGKVEGAVVLTSRVSLEMVQKTAMLGAPLLIAASAPTALAIRTAEECGVTLVCRVRGHSFDVYTHPERVVAGAALAAAVRLAGV